MKRLHLVLLLPLLLLTMAFRQVPLNDPPPIQVPAGVDLAQVRNAVTEALTGRGWAIANHQPGEIDATYARRDFSVTIAVHYDRHQVQINYLDSSNLKYEVKNGVRYIHTNYASWIQNLVTDINNRFAMAH
ncbi:MAG: hypothetical protein JSS21_04120 [Proteobacteria bacterium]|nr:hypothetical protein [Pseudomonadota bacterium]